MSLRERIKSLPVQSLYVGVLVAMVSTLSLSFLAFHLIADHVQRMQIDPTFNKFDELQLESERYELQHGGPTELRSYLNTLDRIFGGTHYLLDANGIDVLNGQSRSALLPSPPATTLRLREHGRWVVAHKAPDGLYWFAAEGQLGRPRSAPFFPTTSSSSAPPACCAGSLQ